MNRRAGLRILTLTVGWVAATAGAARTQDLAPEVIYYNGKIVTVDAAFSVAQAIAVKDGRITAVGTNESVRRLASGATRQVDLQGKSVVPGFYDSHVHVGGEILQEWNGGLISGVPEWIRGADTMDKLLAVLKRRAAETPEGEWIMGSLTREEWPNQRLPTRWDLDKATPKNPLVLRRGPHTLVLNSLALQAAKITKDTKDPPGGWIIRDKKTGEPSGRVLEAADRLVEPYMPPTRREGPRDPVGTWRRQLQRLEGLGITSVNVAGIRPHELGTIQTLYARHGDELPRMTVQIRISPGYDSYDDVVEGAKVSIKEIEDLGFRTGFGDDRLKIGAIKMSIDGGLSAPVMWTTERYAQRDGDFRGVQRIPDETFYAVAKRAHDLGWQLGIHTIGDAAVEMTVREIARIVKESPRADHRHYLHHVAVKPSEATLKTMGEVGIWVSTHPSWTTNLGSYAEEALAPGPRLQTQNPGKSLLAHGVKLAYGSDGLPYGPLVHVWDAVTRRGWDGKIYGPEEAVTREEAIRFHTMGTAALTFDEKVKGSLELGKLADFVVLGQDILTVDAEQIRNIPVELTVIGGKEVYTRTGRTAATSN